jgi:DNA-binding transcriptional LysR family regulator
MDDTFADVRSLLDRLKQAQHALIEDAARQLGLPSTAIIRRIAELENTIAAVLALSRKRRWELRGC